ncbi:MAG: hypothetical protein ACYDCC_06240 [Actinomycetota bacterium]
MRVSRTLIALSLAAGMISTGPAKAAVPSLPQIPTHTPCSILDAALCLLPFPNNHFTAPDSHSPTGLHVDFQPEEMPRNLAGKPIDPTEWNRNDGFSPGSMAITFVPGLDLHQTWGMSKDQITDIGASLGETAPIAIIDRTTGERWPFWSELDMNAQTMPNQRVLILRPATNFLETHRYQVILRNMKDSNGQTIAPSPVFSTIRDNVACDPSLDSNADEIHHTACLIDYASQQGFAKSSLYLTWDFTIASAQNLAGRVLHIRDAAYAALGANGSPPWSIDASKTHDVSGSSTIARNVEGTITVPNFLVEGSGVVGPESVQGLPNQAIPGGRFLYGVDGLPMQNPAIPTMDIPFVCTIPRTASASNPADPVLYGHGLLGSRYELNSSGEDRDRENNLMTCAVNWMGFAEQDVANALLTLQDPSNMSSMMDRTQQGFLNFMLLGRALKATVGGLSTSPAFQDANGHPLFKSGELFYDGNSQGGIMGGALTALDPDLTRSTLGVTGMNYSTLLNRSIDWEGPLVNTDNLMRGDTNPTDYIPSYSAFLYTQFPNKMEQQLVMALLQMLWDRGEADGYAEHMTSNPYEGTPAHTVLMHAAVGDFQVTNFSAEVEARTIGAHFMDTSLAPGRNYTGVDGQVWGLPPMPRDNTGAIAPFDGSTFVYWDSGNLEPPTANIPPQDIGGDPHEDPRRDPRGGMQKANFYRTGEIIDVMNGAPYLTCSSNNVGHFPRVPSTFPYTWCSTYPPN